MNAQSASTHAASGADPDPDPDAYEPQPISESQAERTEKGGSEPCSVDEHGATAQGARSEHDANGERQPIQEAQGQDGVQVPKKRGLFKRKGAAKNRDATPLSNPSTSFPRRGESRSNSFSVTVANPFTTLPPSAAPRREFDAERVLIMKCDGTTGSGHERNLVQQAMTIAEWEDDGKEDHIAGSRHYHDVQRHPDARRLNAIGRAMAEEGNGGITCRFPQHIDRVDPHIAMNRACLDRIH
ncbi:hypothetical protein PMIN06_003235 [Paraphaeosphaeria minitans]|uniref:Uncharacterized protein n=1 Tax=Paraphaeosphaeria minitans TaxID=565426 RepID=A0A9P6G8A3_9PLEO|nr:hypothetical protein PMIN01_12514 [Paraphaeosphaeria minitans]